MPYHQPFDAWLPSVAKSVRISTLNDATVFARRWAIRDKDPALKAIVKRLEHANSVDATSRALDALQQALASRNLLTPPGNG